MEQREKVHLKRFAERLKDALGIKTSWGRNQLYKLVDKELIDYLIDEGDLDMEEAGAVESLTEEEHVVLFRGPRDSPPA